MNLDTGTMLVYSRKDVVEEVEDARVVRAALGDVAGPGVLREVSPRDLDLEAAVVETHGVGVRRARLVRSKG